MVLNIVIVFIGIVISILPQIIDNKANSDGNFWFSKSVRFLRKYNKSTLFILLVLLGILNIYRELKMDSQNENLILTVDDIYSLNCEILFKLEDKYDEYRDYLNVNYPAGHILFYRNIDSLKNHEEFHRNYLSRLKGDYIFDYDMVEIEHVTNFMGVGKDVYILSLPTIEYRENPIDTITVNKYTMIRNNKQQVKLIRGLPQTCFAPLPTGRLYFEVLDINENECIFCLGLKKSYNNY